MTAGPSVHLSWAELACHDGHRTPYPHAWRETRGAVLGRVFELIRWAVGVPLFVTSAYRTPGWNAVVGGARGSQHLHGRALDLVAARPVTIDQLWKAVHALARGPDREVGIRGLGRYDSFVHVDVRPGDRLVVWDARRRR